ncbi:MAG TPA: hypothetical protein VGF80_15470 [Galbitalea sp.]|jgi:hypothetical protein
MERVVLRVMCDERGEISFLFGPWGAIDSAEAIRQIDSGERYFTLQRPDGSREPIEVSGAGEYKRLSTYAHGAELLRPDEAMRIGA